MSQVNTTYMPQFYIAPRQFTAPVNTVYPAVLPTQADMFTRSAALPDIAGNNAFYQAFDRAMQAGAYYSSPSVLSAPVNNVYNPVQQDVCPWVSDPDIKLALTKLAEITHSQEDIAYLNSLGVFPPFVSGKQALDLIQQNQTSVEFADMGDSLAHAQYLNDENKMIINLKYKGNMTEQMALAIADALYHEAGHLKDRDGESSLQEEMDCLALNTLGYRYQQRMYPHIMNTQSNSRLISDGVALYPRLFFDNDSQKGGLINRLADKYGSLPVSSPNHDGSRSLIALNAKYIYNLNPKKDNI